jgi:NADH:ubiquinone oxidoreductase subunit 6 (subunit J)
VTHEWFKATVAALIMFLLLFAGIRVTEWNTEAVPMEDMVTLTDALFGKWVFAFELLSVLLLGALIGALYVGAKTRRDEGGH